MFTWLTRLFTGRRTLRPLPPYLPAMAQGHPISPLTDAAAQARTYGESAWVYVAVNRIAEAAALVPLHVYALDGERRTPIENHPLERLLARPNPFTSGFELIEQTVGMLELTGNAYWFLAGDGGGPPREIWPMRPDRVQVVPGEDAYVRGYLYEIGGQQMPLEAVEVVHFKRWHPANDYLGLSPLQALSLTVQADRAMSAWNRNTFGADNGIPAGIVTLPETTSEADYERAKREWLSNYSGTQRRTAFLRGGSITWQSIAHKHTDLDFLQGRVANRNEILNAFGVPIGLISENATEANATVAERSFIERTLYPKLVRLGAKISAELLPFYPGEAVAAFADIRPTDHRARLDEIRAASGVLSINEMRGRFFGLGPVPWGEGHPAGADDLHTGPEPAPAKGIAGADLHTGPEPAALDELRQWEKFTLNRLNRPGTRPFTVEHLPPETAFEVSARLLAAPDAEAVKAVFHEARLNLKQTGAHQALM